MGHRLILLAALLVSIVAPLHARPSQSAPDTQKDHDPILPGNHDTSSLPTPAAILGFEVGSRAATSAEIEQCFKTWADSDRATLVQYATSHEGRPLYYLVISSPDNIANLDQIKSDLARLADPRSHEHAAPNPAQIPAFAWLAYSIHGDETSGSDAALAVAYHLLASTDHENRRMLDELVVIIDPNMNPDGRERFLQMIREHRGALPNIDDQALLHTGYWPAGRTNHYMFDLNRDWIYAVHPETRGRINAFRQWHPVLFVDAHEMGPQDTFLFSPARDPINPNFPESRTHWNALFAREQAAAFDAHGWRYYTGEWNEGWYPGYSDNWASFRGAIGILYEQARVAQDGVLQANKGVLTYKRAVRHQAVSSIANLRTLLRHKAEVMRDFAAERRDAATGRSELYARRAWAIVPDANTARADRFLDLMSLQGFEVRVAGNPFTATGTDPFGRPVENRQFPAGTLIVHNQQPEAHLIATMFEFDRRMTDEYLASERKENLLRGSTRIYDVTAWNIPMMFGLDAYELTSGFPAHADLYTPRTRTPLPPDRADVAWVIHGADDDSVTLAARLLDRGIQVRVARKDITWGDDRFPRGSVLITIDDNRNFSGDLRQAIRSASAELSLDATAVNTGLGEGELPDLGGEYFPLLQRPRIALISRGSTNLYDAGSIWHELDCRMSLPITILDADSIAYIDLRRYNTLIVPGSWGQSPISQLGEAITQWVQAGGTLIAIDDSAAAAASSDAGLGSVRVLPEVLDDIKPYELALLRELAAHDTQVAYDPAWSFVPVTVEYPWDFTEDALALPDAAELKQRDEWQQPFMPQGAFLAARVDDEHWLTFGCRDTLPILMGNNPVLMSAPPAEAPIRLGIYEESDSQAPTRIGWGVVPAGKSLRLRMSGLLWPEAAQRLANAAWITRERVGSGQVILFASSPTFRGATPAMARVFRNAVVFGPGLGASHPITR